MEKVVTGEAVTFGGNNNGTLRLRGKNNLEGTSKQYSAYSQISFGKTDVNVACTGDIRTLLDYTNYKDVATKSARFRHLFEDCTQLTSAPDLPAKTLADGCYSYMFSGCSKLETGPKELPATTLAESCYMGMFRNCTNLKNVPDELPAKTMFKIATSICSRVVLLLKEVQNCLLRHWQKAATRTCLRVVQSLKQLQS